MMETQIMEGIHNILRLIMGIITITITVRIHADDDSKMVSNIVIDVIKGTTSNLATDSMLHSNLHRNHLVEIIMGEIMGCKTKEEVVVHKGITVEMVCKTNKEIISSNRIWTK